MPQAVKWLSTLTAFGVAFEWYEWYSINGVDGMEIASAGICLVGRDFTDRKGLGSCLYQFGRLRSFGGLWGRSLYGSHYMGIDAAHQMGFYPLYLASHLAPPMVKPSVIHSRGKARGINGKGSFYSTQRTGTLLNQRLEQRCQFWILKITSIAGERRELGDKCLCFCFSNSRHEASAGHSAIDFIGDTEYYISQRKSRTSESLRRLRNSVAQIPEQHHKLFLFMHLSFVVDSPVLSISDPHSFSDDFCAIRPFLFSLDELDGVDMLALLVCGLKVSAGAKRLPLPLFYLPKNLYGIRG